MSEATNGSNPNAAAASPRSDAAEPRPLAPIYALAAVLAACSILYELILAQTLAILLGNTVLRYSLTIGCFLGAVGIGAMRCRPRPGEAARQLLGYELALSVLGALAVPIIHLLDIAQRDLYFSPDTLLTGTAWVPLLFFLFSHLLILAIGYLTGFEIPLLLALGEARQPGSTNRILGVDYLGALVGSVLFPLLFVRRFGMLVTGFMVAIVNALACVAIAALAERPGRARQTAFLGAAAVVVWTSFGLLNAASIEAYFLDKFYYMRTHDSLVSLFAPRTDDPPVERHRSDYQVIDIVKDEGHPMAWMWNILSTKVVEDPDYPTDVRLYLSREYQFFSAIEEVYHEWFAHVPPQAVARPPRRVLVLGGGDGLLLRELRRYDSIERIVHVELDPEMVRLAREHPLLTRLNGRPDLDPRVETVVADAFDWLRRHDDLFDAIYVDMPFPRNYTLSQVYSREFYSLARVHLAEGGFLMFDAPGAGCHRTEKPLWSIFQSTLSEAGFETIVPVLTRFDVDAARIREVIHLTAYRIAQAVLDEETKREMTPEMAEAWLRKFLDDRLRTAIQEFVLAFPDRREVNDEWIDMGVETYVLLPEHLRLAFERDCPDVRDPDRVNSVFRPTLPPIDFTHVASP